LSLVEERTPEWYTRLIRDCISIKREAEIDVFKRWHELGGRIKKDKDKLERLYGAHYVERVARDTCIGASSVWRALQFVEKYPSWEDDVLPILSHERELSWRQFYMKMLPEPRPVSTPELPEGVYDVIYADPPWKYEFSLSSRGDPEKHYPVMELDQICRLKIPSADDSVLFLWATAPKLSEALIVMDAWGFEYRTNLVWIKDRMGTGFYFRGQHEHLLVGKKGDMPAPPEEARIPSVFEAPRRGHSEKPEIVYDIIERMYPNGRYLELFARNNHRIGWTVWGDEA
jgi:N6-adenosine-specific RNA methylase IME4